MNMPSPNEVTLMLVELREGDPGAPAKLMPLVYNELRRLAHSYMKRERPDHTLQATALVHEAYMRLVGQTDIAWQNRAHFFGFAARLMRQILMERARRSRAARHGGGLRKLSLDAAVSFSETSRDIDLIALDEALIHLASFDERQSRIVELRFFGGLTIEEAAEVIGVSSATVKREWDMAKAWLYGQLHSNAAE
ncbi:MAG: sigma-70 family RNA polymerase sigma factor [Pyrinomonadaceae bacterium]